MRRRLFLILFAAGAAAGLVALVLLSPRQPARVDFPNGSRVEFLGATVGNQIFSTEKRWYKFAARLLPRSSKWFAPVVSGSCGNTTNSITVFIRVADPSGGLAVGRIPWSAYTAEDDDGFRYARAGGYCSFSGSATDRVMGLPLTAYPRRQPDFTFHFLDANQAVLGTLRVANPVRGPFPKWEPRGLPQSQTNGPVVLTLERIQEAGREPWRSVSPTWKIISTNPAWANAKPKPLTLYDATGNEGQWLSPREPAWKARTVVHRNDATNFEAGERLWIPGLVVPTNGAFVAIDKVAELAGVNIKVHLLAGAGRLFRTNGTSFGMIPPAPGEGGDGFFSYGNGQLVEYWGSERPFVFVEALNIQPDDEVRFRLFDDRGRSEIDRSEWLPWNQGRLYKREFTPPDGGGSISLEIIVSRPLSFEFMVSPKDLQPRKPKTDSR